MAGPPCPGHACRWAYEVSFRRGKTAALGEPGEAMAPFDGQRGDFTIGPTDKTGRDFREGRLHYVRKHHLQLAGDPEYFLKAGPDAPETFLAYADFDNTQARRKNVPLKI